MVQWTKHWKQSLGKSSQEIKQCSGPNSAPCITVRICFEGPSGSLVHISSCPSGRKHCDANPAMGFSTAQSIASRNSTFVTFDSIRGSLS